MAIDLQNIEKKFNEPGDGRSYGADYSGISSLTAEIKGQHGSTLADSASGWVMSAVSTDVDALKCTGGTDENKVPVGQSDDSVAWKTVEELIDADAIWCDDGGADVNNALVPQSDGTVDWGKLSSAAISVPGGAEYQVLVAGALSAWASLAVAIDNGAKVCNTDGSEEDYVLVGNADGTGTWKARSLVSGAMTVVDMADAAHAIVVGTPGANETELVSNICVVDPNSSGASETLTLPAVGDFVGHLTIVNIGGENVVVSDTSTTILPGGGLVTFYSDGSSWRDRAIVSGTASVSESAPDLIVENFQAPAAAGTNVVAQMAGDVDESDPANITQNAGIFRNVQAVFSAGWDGGDIEVTGLTTKGEAETETITANPGSTVEGTLAFISITRVQNLGTHSAGTCDVEHGPKLGVRVGSKTPTLVQVMEVTADGVITGTSTLGSEGLLTLPGGSVPNGAKTYTVAATLATSYTDAGHTHTESAP